MRFIRVVALFLALALALALAPVARAEPVRPPVRLQLLVDQVQQRQAPPGDPQRWEVCARIFDGVAGEPQHEITLLVQSPSKTFRLAGTQLPGKRFTVDLAPPVTALCGGVF